MTNARTELLLEALDTLEEVTEELARQRAAGASLEVRLELTRARRLARQAVLQAAG